MRPVRLSVTIFLPLELKQLVDLENGGIYGVTKV